MKNEIYPRNTSCTLIVPRIFSPFLFIIQYLRLWENTNIMTFGTTDAFCSLLFTLLMLSPIFLCIYHCILTAIFMIVLSQICITKHTRVLLNEIMVFTTYRFLFTIINNCLSDIDIIIKRSLDFIQFYILRH